MHKHWMIDNADMLKTLKQRDRNRGYHTGKSAKGWIKKATDFAPVQPGSWDDLRARARHAWFASCDGAVEAFCAAVYPRNHGTLMSDADTAFLDEEGFR